VLALIARAVSVALLVASVAAVARADTTDDCVAANARAQALRKAEKLREAHDELVRCSAEACPKMVRDDCAARIEEVDRAIPTIVFLAKDASGHDVTHASVTMDGASLGELAGRALEVTVGDHEFSFTASNYKPLSRHFVIVEGQKGRLETVVLAPLVEPQKPPAIQVVAVTPAEPVRDLASERARRKTMRVVGFTLGAIGLAGFVTAIPFAALGASQNDALRNGGFATADDMVAADDTGKAYNVGLAVSLIAGTLFLGIGATLVLTHLEILGSPGGVAVRW
jgi:hypothetical protein